MESRAKLNTPGKKDGENQLWIDAKLEAERTGLDWRGNFAEKGINAVFLEAYWNQGSPVDQSRWIDHFVIATEPIGPIVSNKKPVVVKTPYAGPGQQKAWQLEVAKRPDGTNVVWRSELIRDGDQVALGKETGSFLKFGDQFVPDTLYYLRVRQQSTTDSEWSDWSTWHQPFRTPQ